MSGDNYLPNTQPENAGGVRTTVPDGTADGIIDHKIGADIRVPRAAWFEVKATDKTIYNSTSTGQIRNHVDNLAASVPAKYRYYGRLTAASLTIITTADVTVSPGVVLRATGRNILMYQYTSEYTLTTQGYLRVRFRLNVFNGVTAGPTSNVTSSVIMR